VWQVAAAGLHRRSQALVEQGDFAGNDFDLAGRQLGIYLAFKSMRDLTGDHHHKLAAKCAGNVEIGSTAFGANVHLGFPVAIAQVEEQSATVIAVTVDPTTKS